MDRGIGHLCRDSEDRKRRGRKGTYLWADLQPIPSNNTLATATMAPIYTAPSPSQMQYTPSIDQTLTPILTPVIPLIAPPSTVDNLSDLDINQLNPDLKSLFLELFLSGNDETSLHVSSLYNGEKLAEVSHFPNASLIFLFQGSKC
jgi:lipopolysaccharide assembly outer membrane protein LptD (OstA)